MQERIVLLNLIYTVRLLAATYKARWWTNRTRFSIKRVEKYIAINTFDVDDVKLL